MTKQFADFSAEIYQAGTKGTLPRYPLDAESIERKGAEAMPDWLLSYVASGSGNGHTQRANIAAFEKWGIVPRMCNGRAERDLSIDLFGMRLPTPIFLPPVGVMGICTQDFHGDLAVARAAASTGVPVIQSTLSQDPLENIAPAMGDTPGLFQLYTPKDRDLAISFIQRAEKAGYRGLVVTLDSWVTGWRPHDLNHANFPQAHGYCMANFFTDEHFRKRLATAPEDDIPAAVAEWERIFGHSLTWDDFTWIRESTDLPILVKGINHPDDARHAIDLGVDGIYCSNHGGRQANGGVPTLDVLPAVVAAAGDVPVLFDSGVRSGTDVVKALALGATAVGIGRTYLYALALGGEDALVHHLRAILAEADLLMALDGYPTIADLHNNAIQRVT
ncbi:alpha-hydroxy-acid oxidizing protein [Nocardia sp. NPDC051052]|uniref:alpha-hydroxy-acid oxidizing protein n=1 Tax=Nocardia sp. NPDC051052 TaxID=3364322 RepID=UPI003788F1CE